MEQINQIAWDDGRGLSALAEDGVYQMQGFIEILGSTVQEYIEKDETRDPGFVLTKRLLTLVTDLMVRARDIEDALNRFDREYKAKVKEETFKRELRIIKRNRKAAKA